MINSCGEQVSIWTKLCMKLHKTLVCLRRTTSSDCLWKMVAYFNSPQWWSFPVSPTVDEDGMDCMDNERRPHFPQFSYSASGREWVLHAGTAPRLPISSCMVTMATTGPSAPNQPLSLSLFLSRSLSPNPLTPPPLVWVVFTHWVKLKCHDPPWLYIVRGIVGHRSGLQVSSASSHAFGCTVWTGRPWLSLVLVFFVLFCFCFQVSVFIGQMWLVCCFCFILHVLFGSGF